MSRKSWRVDRFDCIREFHKNIDKVVKNFFDYQVIQKIAKPHRILKLGFSLRTLAEIASLKYIKENADIH